MKTSNFFSRYTPPIDDGISFKKPSLTQQHFKDECDINSIVKNFPNGATIPVNPKAIYADVSDMPTNLIQARDFIANAQYMFMQLPSDIRDKYKNDPLLALEAYQQQLSQKTNVTSTESESTNVSSSAPDALDSIGAE